MSADEVAGAPPGFVELPMFGTGGFNSLCGPLWVRVEGVKLVGGFRVETRHCNPAGNCHGGMLATFCDVHMALGTQFEHTLGTLILPTISLSIDYLAPTLKGAWVEAQVEIAKLTRGMVFASETITADGEPVARASGIYKIPSLSREPGAGKPADTGASLRAFLKVRNETAS